jgi:phosphohistidine phosphatase
MPPHPAHGFLHPIVRFVQIRLTIVGAGEKLIVRSMEGPAFHAEIFSAAMKCVRNKHGGSVKGSVVGGGRIEYDTQRKFVKVFGYSKTFGRAPGCNRTSAELIRIALPGLEVDYSDAGY